MKNFDENYWLFNKPCAHRGLHNGKNIPENSLKAFFSAVEKGYPIELDVHLTKDKKLVVFHDDNLKRLTGLNADIRDKSFSELSALRLYGTDQQIPLFSDVLRLVNGKVPLLIEIKQQKQKGIEETLLNELESYSGEYAFQSFDPFVLFNLKKLNKNAVFGLLAGLEDSSKDLPFYKKHVLKRMSFNLFLQPDFINYRLKSLPIRRLTNKKTPLLCWTVRSYADLTKAEKCCVNFVFENVLP